MKNTYFLRLKNLLFLVITLLATNAFAQIHIDDDKDVSIGTTNTNNAKLNIVNSANKYTIFLNSTSTLDANKIYGIANFINATNTSEKIGFYNQVTQSSNNNTYDHGIYSKIISNNAKGTSCLRLETIGNQNGILRGIYNYIAPLGTGKKYGHQNVVFGTPGAANQIVYGLNNQVYLSGSGGSQIGIFNQTFVRQESTGTKYGIYNRLKPDPSSNNTGGGTGNRYALYSQIVAEPGQVAYAGYFDGDVHITGNLSPFSDRKLKENITGLEGGLALIKKMTPKVYNFKKDLPMNLPSGKQYGLIAQEVEEVLPAIVRDIEHPGSLKETKIKHSDSGLEEMEIKEDASSTYKSVNYQALIPVLISAIQEQQSQIEKQNEQLKRMEQELEALKNDRKKN